MTISVQAGPLGEGKMDSGLAVTFTNLNYTVKTKKGPYQILTDINGHFEPGKLTALMGPSGSGKTTLMDIMAGRKTTAGAIEGEILYGGSPVTKQILKTVCGYVEQFDTLVGEFTVAEMLMYTADLKLPRSMSRADKQKRCDEIIETLRLTKCRDTKIGNALQRGISGGQAKRVNIAIALVTRPRVLYLDEPTSGLDSRMSNDVCVLLKECAMRDRCTVVATIHSPTAFAFSQFDNLLMLQAGGKVVYNAGVPAVRSYFESRSFVFEGSGHALPDWLVDITSEASEVGTAKVDAGSHADAWAASKEGQDSRAAILKATGLYKGRPVDLNAIPTAGPGQFFALGTLLRYRMGAHYKSGEFLGPRFGDKIFMSVLCLSLYWGIGDKTDAKSINSTAALLFFFTALCGYGAAAYVPSLTMERALFYRERADGCYWSITYYLHKFIEESVLCTLTATIFSVIVFFSLHLQGNFFVFVLAYYLTAMTGICLAYAVAAIAPNMEAANALLPTYVTTCMYFGGLFLCYDKIPPGWYWYSFTSFLRWAWGMIMLNHFSNSEVGAQKIFYDADKNEMITVLEFYGMDTGIMSHMWGCCGILALLVVIFASCGAAALTFVSHVRR